jgi:exopolysaccharide biosynthesis polyprenyl glycosylphosphotransferase
MNPKKLQFSISERKLLLRLFDLAITIGGLSIISSVFNFHYFNFQHERSLIWLLTFSFYLLLFGEIFEMYNLRVANEKYLTIRSAILTGLLTTLFYVFTPIIAPELPANRFQILYLFIGVTLAIIVWRFLYIYLIFSPLFFKKILLIGSTKEVQHLIELIAKNHKEYSIAGYIAPTKIEDCELEFFRKSTNLKKLVEEQSINEIIVETFSDHEYSTTITKQLIKLFEEGVVITGADNFKESLNHRIPESWLNDSFYNYLSFSNSQQNRLYLFVHRFVDISCSLIGIVFLILLVPLVFLGNLIANKGSIFYTQQRIGKKGKPFNIIKLRSMVDNAELGGAMWATIEDKRVTKFGKFLRRTRLDEVPQFINILKGDMSLIGPRPERPEFVELLEKTYSFYAVRHVIKPGLTGWAQVEYPYANTIEEQSIKLRYDLYYIKERNLLLDFKIVIRTISTVLFLKGT